MACSFGNFCALRGRQCGVCQDGQAMECEDSVGMVLLSEHAVILSSILNGMLALIWPIHPCSVCSHAIVADKVLWFFAPGFAQDTFPVWSKSPMTVSWMVSDVQLSKHKRHQDKTAVLAFWESLDKSIRARKLNLTFWVVVTSGKVPSISVHNIFRCSAL